MIALINGSVNYGFRVSRKCKIWKPATYGAIPHYNKPYFFDTHGQYKLRSFDQVKSEIQALDLKIQVRKPLYSPDDMAYETKSRKATIYFGIDQFNMTEMQMERFQILMGPKYLQKTKEGRIVCEIHPAYNQNLQKALEQMRDVILQSKRAP